MSIPRGRRGVVCLWAGLLIAGCSAGTVGSGSGVAGTTGAAGATSVAGTSGAMGAAGMHGAAGATGAAGTHGAAGAGGSAGSTGAAGMHGAAGAGGSAGSTGAAGTMAGVDPYAAARQACVDKINMFRATLSLPALTRWTAEESCTDGEAKSDSESGMAHGAFSSCMELAQDECPGWPSVDSIAGGTKSCLDQMWAEGPGMPYEAHGHYINMSNPKYTKVACGYYTTPAGKIWAAQDLR